MSAGRMNSERKEKSIPGIYGRVVETAARENLKRFMLDHLDAGAKARTDRWGGYKGHQCDWKSGSIFIRDMSSVSVLSYTIIQHFLGFIHCGLLWQFLIIQFKNQVITRY
jgi:hypothetical protein